MIYYQQVLLVSKILGMWSTTQERRHLKDKLQYTAELLQDSQLGDLKITHKKKNPIKHDALFAKKVIIILLWKIYHHIWTLNIIIMWWMMKIYWMLPLSGTSSHMRTSKYKYAANYHLLSQIQTWELAKYKTCHIIAMGVFSKDDWFFSKFRHENPPRDPPHTVYCNDI